MRWELDMQWHGAISRKLAKTGVKDPPNLGSSALGGTAPTGRKYPGYLISVGWRS